MVQENIVNELSLKAIFYLYGKNFFISDFQRGYRWEEKFNGYTMESNEDRSFFLIDIPCHPDFVGENLSQVVSQVKGADLTQVANVFVSLLDAKSKAELMAMFEHLNRTRFKRTRLDILIHTGLATPTIPDKLNSRFQKYVLTEKGKQLLSECKSK